MAWTVLHTCYLHYYNEIDSYAADWLENLMTARLIPEGVVDRRDIRDVRPIDLRGFIACHFFAGLGGWPYALRLAGWPDDRPVWTGSCPCQPFSAAGKGRGFADERHLWPAWHWLIQQSKPDVVFGEQVDRAVDWLDLVAADLEEEGYRVGAGVLPAAGAGAPHGRHRLWFVADTVGERHERERVLLHGRGSHEDRVETARRSAPGKLAESSSTRTGWDAGTGVGAETASASARDFDRRVGDTSIARGAVGDVVNAGHGAGRPCNRGSDRAPESTRTENNSAPLGASEFDELGYSDDPRPQGREQRGNSASECSPWAPSLVEWIPCRDGKWRPVEPGTFPLAHGVPNRVGRLRAYGNAIVPHVAAEFIRAYLDC